MSFDPAKYRTIDGVPFRVLSDTLRGDNPYAIEVNGEVVTLNSALACSSNPGYSLVRQGTAHTRFFNVYRAADGAFVFGSRAFKSNIDRLAVRDAQRAIAAVSVTLNEENGTVSATLV